MHHVEITPEVLALGHGFGYNSATRQRVVEAQRRAVRRPPVEILLDSIRRTRGDRMFVEFSGGVDSSLILSAACRVAAERDTSPPTPVTLRYRAAATNENEYQERMIDHLGLDDWTIIEVDDELDLVGAASGRHLREHGLSYAPRTAGRDWWLSRVGNDPSETAVLLNGEGGDEVLATAPLVVAHAIRYSVRTRRFGRQAMGLAAERSRRVLRSRQASFSGPDWYTSAGREMYERVMRSDRRRSPTMKKFMQNYRSRIPTVTGQRNLVDQARRYGLEYSSPLLDIDAMAGFTASIPDHHFINRALVVRRYFSELLPPEIVHRTSKVYFSDAIYNEATRRFAQDWDGRTGVPVHYVDPERVRSAWANASDARSGLMLQSAWLASNGAPQ